MSKKSANKRKKKRELREAKIRKEIQNRRDKFIKSIDRSIPDYPQIDDWDIPPTPPFHVDEIDLSRCHYLSIIIKDANNVKYAFSFGLEDRLVYAAELFYPWEGMGYDENRFAYIKLNSKLEKEVFPAIENALDNKLKEYGKEQVYVLPKFKECLNKAKTYTRHWK